ncbi:Peptidase family M48 protein [Dioscorea alata]|uniref:Peptidase family M48 protein n=1 Tax=Dioscorea alata TaxID=55571 RepID=A0ACB7U709_DIOAL|nr:Peptidase family M48 protein [Dioscorea alata]
MNFLRRSLPLLRRSISSKITSPKPSPPPPPSLFSKSISNPNPIPNPSSQWRRFYYFDRGQLQHFRRRSSRRWYQNSGTVLIVIVLSGCTIFTVYYGHLETVPYTKRSHFILLSPSIERQLGEHEFQQIKDSLKGKILPAIHPDSVRVRLIAKDIIEALQRGLRHDTRQWGDLGYASEVPEWEVDPEKSKETLLALRRGDEAKLKKKEGWSSEDEILDDKWVHASRKKAAESHSSRSVPQTRHLEGLNWEVLVVRDNTVNAFCLPGGKIVVFTGLLDHFRTDAEIATVLGHEVAHAIARHSAEMITKSLWFAIVQLILLQFFFMPDLINAMSTLLLRLPFSRRMEIEADYVGLLLMASAGYDPRVAPGVYERLGKISGESLLNDYISTHPSSKTRAKLLSQAQVMEEALSVYRDAVAGHVVSGFL